MSKRVVFVLQRALGWNTYAKRLIAVAEARTDLDLEFDVVDVTHRSSATLFNKRHNMSSADKVYRKRDPIQHYQGALGAEVRARLAKLKPDVVHFAGNLPAAAIAFETDQIPFTVAMDVTRAAIERDLPRGVWSASDLERDAELARKAAHVFPMSTWIALSLIKDYGVDEERVTVMPPSIDVPKSMPQRLNPGPEQTGGKSSQNPDQLKIVFIGNDFLRKGGDRLCAWVAGPLAEIAELHVISADPDAKPGAAGPKPNVIFHGRVPNEVLLTEILPSMDVFCLPTRSDMSPQVLAEAAAAGLPSVSSNFAGIPDLVEHNKTGLLADPSDDAAFIANLRRLAQDRAFAQALGRQAYEHALSNLNAQTNFNDLLDRLAALASS
ncbi:MAG: glycosyltransferase family 4 protein [Pseudomonadota bacterium]